MLIDSSDENCKIKFSDVFKVIKPEKTSEPINRYCVYQRFGVNFINILWAAFTSADPESAKKTVKLSVFFALSVSVHAMAASRNLMTLTPGLAYVRYDAFDLKLEQKFTTKYALHTSNVTKL